MPPLTPDGTTPARRWRRVLEDPAEAARAFPSLAAAMAPGPQRRGLLKLMAASFALGGLSGCGDPATSDTGWVPAVEAPPGIVPGLPNRFTTMTTAGGAGLGLVVEHRMGRPVKVEGNPLHPASLGATDALAQALVLDFYDPDRAAGMLREGRPATMAGLLDILVPVRASLAAARGAGLRILTGACVSPTLGAALDALLARLPEARWHQWEADGSDAPRAGAVLAYGRPLVSVPRLDAADVVVGLESDLVSGAPGWVRHARDLAGRRNPARGPMSRIHAVETVPSLLGGIADRRVAAGPAELHRGLMALAAGVLTDFAIPAFRIKHDVLPGRYESLWFTATEPGAYRLFCTQFCGADHSVMGGQVVVMSGPDFERWLADNAAGAGMVAEGRTLFTRYGCSGCHQAEGRGQAAAVDRTRELQLRPGAAAGRGVRPSRAAERRAGGGGG